MFVKNRMTRYAIFILSSNAKMHFPTFQLPMNILLMTASSKTPSCRRRIKPDRPVPRTLGSPSNYFINEAPNLLPRNIASSKHLGSWENTRVELGNHWYFFAQLFFVYYFSLTENGSHRLGSYGPGHICVCGQCLPSCTVCSKCAVHRTLTEAVVWVSMYAPILCLTGDETELNRGVQQAICGDYEGRGTEELPEPAKQHGNSAKPHFRRNCRSNHCQRYSHHPCSVNNCRPIAHSTELHSTPPDLLPHTDHRSPRAR